MCLRRLNYDRKELERKREESQSEVKGECMTFHSHGALTASIISDFVKKTEARL